MAAMPSAAREGWPEAKPSSLPGSSASCSRARRRPRRGTRRPGRFDTRSRRERPRRARSPPTRAVCPPAQAPAGLSRPARTLALPARLFRLFGARRSLSGLAAGLRFRAARKLLEKLDLVVRLPDPLEQLGDPAVPMRQSARLARRAALQALNGCRSAGRKLPPKR